MKTIKATIEKTILFTKTMDIEVPHDFSDEQITNLIQDKIYHNGEEWKEKLTIDTSWLTI